MIHPHGLRLAGIKIVNDQRGSTLAKATSEVIEQCQAHEIHISGVVSDNGPSLVAALTNMNPNDPLSLRVLIGLAILRCSCAAHTSQLAVNDVVRSSTTLFSFFNQITELLSWISKRCEDFKTVCPLKIPQFIATRWNTLASCGNFIIKNQELVNDFIQRRTDMEQATYDSELAKFQNHHRRTMPEVPTHPPVNEVPREWAEYVDALNVIAEFTDAIEGDLQLQQQVYTSIVTTEAKLADMQQKGNIIAGQLLDAFRERFIRTADVVLAHLAYVLTPCGLSEFQALPNNAEKRRTASQLKEKFLSLAANLEYSGPEVAFLPALFDNFIRFASVNPGEDPFAYWENLADESLQLPQINGGQPVSLKTFSTISLILISLPASEAMVERAFSQLKAIATDFNKSTARDLILALSIIKLCVRYKNKYTMKLKIKE